MGDITVKAEDDLTREQGHARLVIEGLSGVDFAQLSAQTTQYWIRRSGFTEPNLSDGGWQVAEVDLNPVAIEVDGNNLVLVVGPNIVEAIDPFSTLSFSLQLPGQPVAEATLLWPDITPPIMRAANDGRALGEATSEAPVVEADDTEEKAREAKLVVLEEERKRVEAERKQADERQVEKKRFEDERKIEAAQRALEEKLALFKAEKKAEEFAKIAEEFEEPEVDVAVVSPSASLSESDKSKSKTGYVIVAAVIGVILLGVVISSPQHEEITDCAPPPPDTYSGACENGLRNGRGIYEWENGVRYVGDWKDGIPHGRGTVVLGSNLYTGIWKNGCFNERRLQLVFEDVSTEDCGW